MKWSHVIIPLTFYVFVPMAQLARGADWRKLGCYKDEMVVRALPHYFHTVDTLDFDDVFPDLVKFFEICRVRAEKLGYHFFAIQFYSECWGAFMWEKYDRYGRTDNCGVGKDGYGVGFEDANFVYERLPKVDGQWSLWSSFTPCTKDCGGGVQFRARTCTKPAPQSGGKLCLGDDHETKACNLQSCKADGGWSGWSNFSRCTESCGGGAKIRSRACTNPPPRGGGKTCQGPRDQSEACNTNPCPVDGKWAAWGAYAPCDKPCGGGVQQRNRTCADPAPQHGGKPCEGPATQSQACNQSPCPVDGGWSEWKNLGNCSKSCGGGTQNRSRACTSPPPQHGGASCQGASTEILKCNQEPCPIQVMLSKCQNRCQICVDTATLPPPPLVECAEDLPRQAAAKLSPKDLVVNNRFLAAVNDVSKGMVEAGEVRRNFADKTHLHKLLTEAVKKEKFMFARRVIGFLVHNEYRGEKPEHRCKKDGKILQNILSVVGKDKYNALMAVENEASLMFVIDTSGSMGQAIIAAKNIVKAVARIPRKGKTDYILSPFKDPGWGNLTKYNESQRSQFVDAIDALTASEGGDCPELAFHGIVDAMKKGNPRPDSPMYVFTDAQPKDADDATGYDVDSAIGLTLDYMTTVNMFYGPKFSICKAAQDSEDFKRLVSESDGQELLFFDNSEIEKVAGLVSSDLDGTAPVAAGGRDLKRRRRSTDDSRYSFSVDDTIERLVITVTAKSGNIAPIQLKDPKEEVRRQTTPLVYGVLYIVERPEAGTWVLEVPQSVGKHTYTIKASSYENIDFDYFFTTKQGNRETPVALPLTGTKSTVHLLLPNYEKFRKGSLRLEIVPENEVKTATVPLDGLAGSFVPPPESFKFRLSGKTNTGTSFQRLSRRKVEAKSALVRMLYNKEYLTIHRGRKTYVYFAVANSHSREKFNVSIQNSVEGISYTLNRNNFVVSRSGRSYIRATFTANSAVAVGEVNIVQVTARGLTSNVHVTFQTELMVVE